jgi:hypothetical protein
MAFNETPRVKLPALVHLCKLGYHYVSEKVLTKVCDTDTNINVDVFKNKLRQFNPLLKPIEIDQFLDKLKIVLDNDDLGREFYAIVSANSGIKLIDFEYIENNDFDTLKLKETFRVLCKRLHPDLNPNQSEQEKDLFIKVKAAYDLQVAYRYRAFHLYDLPLHQTHAHACDACCLFFQIGLPTGEARIYETANLKHIISGLRLLYLPL